jgi:chaperonin GroEL
VVRAALQNAAAVASLMLTTETLIGERPRKKSSDGHGGGGTGDIGGGDNDF